MVIVLSELLATALATEIVAAVELSDVFTTVMSPVPLAIASLKVSTISAPTETPVASSLGFEEDRVGGAVSAAVNVET